MTQFEKLDLLLRECGGTIQTFQVLNNGISKSVFYAYVKERGLEQAAHGVYVSPDTWTDAMYLLHLRCGQAVFSHETALFFHDLTDREPLKYTITVRTGYNPSRLHALLEAYSKEKKLEKKQLCNAEEILQKCVKQGMYFAFFGKLPVSVLSPYQLDDKTFVEYHADPSAKVTLYYALDAGLGNQVKYQTEPLRDLYEGIFAKSFTLFYGETLRYYFESVTGERVNRTQERVLTMNKIEGTPVSKYHMINQMLSARRLDKKKEVFSQVKKYLRQEQYVKKMFVIEKEEQEQIVLKPGGTNERNS